MVVEVVIDDGGARPGQGFVVSRTSVLDVVVDDGPSAGLSRVQPHAGKLMGRTAVLWWRRRRKSKHEQPLQCQGAAVRTT